jgi:uncharacterized membrane protein YhfC
MDTTLRLLNAALMVALPLVLGLFLARRYGVGWTLFGWGAVTFVGSQVVHLPLLQALTLAFRDVEAPALRADALLTNAVILGVAAGVCEEGARYVGYRYLVPGARSWDKGLMLGAGHGGIEAIILGVLTGAATLHVTTATAPMPDVSAIAASPTTVRTLPLAPFSPLLGATERVFALASHLALSVMVLQVFVRRSRRWLLAAIGGHAVLDGATVYLAPKLSPVALEGILGGFAIAGVGIIGWLRPARRPDV